MLVCEVISKDCFGTCKVEAGIDGDKNNTNKIYLGRVMPLEEMVCADQEREKVYPALMVDEG